MSRYRYPDYKSHKQEHEEIKDCIASIKKYHAQPVREILYQELRGFMNYYILKHMVMTDKAREIFSKPECPRNGAALLSLCPAKGTMTASLLWMLQ